MSAPRRGIGRGLAAILPASEDVAEAELRNVPVASVLPNPDQPRKRFSAESISGLADSLREAGVVQPLIVRPLADGRYELIAGERRWRAAREAGLGTVPVILRDEDESTRMQMALIENVVREGLNPVDEARACAALIDDLGLTKEELAKRLGRSRSSISNLIRVLDLPDEALALLEAGELSEGHGRALLLVKDAEERRRLAADAARNGWSVRETERRAQAGPRTRSGKVVPHPDQEAALQGAADALEGALGIGVRVSPARRGIRAELRFEDLDELLDFARRRQAGA